MRSALRLQVESYGVTEIPEGSRIVVRLASEVRSKVVVVDERGLHLVKRTKLLLGLLWMASPGSKLSSLCSN